MTLRMPAPSSRLMAISLLPVSLLSFHIDIVGVVQLAQFWVAYIELCIFPD